jgi:UDP-N-acetylglucosamine--N-acetylmuramyl-(pentapeptide) pyrophosphoryl-undecaprenol N-acetylglucosamine transferase
MRMIVAGGGTGGHLFPGLAVAQRVASERGGAVLFVGSSSGIEARIIPRTAVEFRPVPMRGLRGRGWRGALQIAWQLPAAVALAWRIVGDFRAQIVLGVGGYASFPVVLAAWLRGVPSVLLEQNARPGLANRVLGRLARRICTTFAEAQSGFPAGKVVRTGNPVRTFSVPPAAERQGFTLLVFGGSQGARRINDAMSAVAGSLQARIPDLRVVHQTGTDDRERLRQAYAEAGVQAEVHSFIDDMGAAYERADLVVCRAGATTVAELTALGKAAILVPYPFAADDHQRANAAVLADHGAGILILDGEFTGERLLATVVELASDRKRLMDMEKAARDLAVPDAVERVVQVCHDVVREGVPLL